MGSSNTIGSFYREYGPESADDDDTKNLTSGLANSINSAQIRQEYVKLRRRTSARRHLLDKGECDAYYLGRFQPPI